jgi:hypothetical protein
MSSARLLGVQEVVGSNPASPTKTPHTLRARKSFWKAVWSPFLDAGRMLRGCDWPEWKFGKNGPRFPRALYLYKTRQT